MEANKLIGSGKAVPLKYFAKGNVKKGYALFESPELSSRKWKSYFEKAFAEIEFGVIYVVFSPLIVLWDLLYIV